MRVPSPIALAAAALFVGASVAPSMASVVKHPPVSPAFQMNIIPKVMTRAQALKYMNPSAAIPRVHEMGMRYARTHRPDLSKIHRDGKTPGLWLTDDAGYIWGLKKPGKGKVGTYLTDCSGAEGGVISPSGALVVACTNTSTVNVYNAGNNSGPADAVLDDTPGFYPAAAFTDAAGNIYATNLYGFSCTTYYCYFYPGNVVEWYTSNQGNGASPSATITDPNMYEVYFGTADASGNLYIDGFNNSFIPAVDQLHNGNSIPLAISPHFPGGLTVSNAGQLGVNDQGDYGSGDGSFTLYTLPSLGVAFQGAFPQNLNLLCDPVAVNLDGANANAYSGDAGCHAAASLSIPGGTGGDALNINFDVPIAGIPTT